MITERGMIVYFLSCKHFTRSREHEILFPLSIMGFWIKIIKECASHVTLFIQALSLELAALAITLFCTFCFTLLFDFTCIALFSIRKTHEFFLYFFVLIDIVSVNMIPNSLKQWCQHDVKFFFHKVFAYWNFNTHSFIVYRVKNSNFKLM